MDIVVLMKQVPDTAALIQISEDNVSIKTEDVKWVINPYDELAVEEAIRIREKQGGGKVIILTAGAGSASATIRTALAMGADEGILISDPALENSDPQITAKVIAAVLNNVNFDLIIAGPRAVDDDSSYVPAAISEYLGVPLLSTVIRQEISNGKIQCEQTVQDGSIVLEANLPAIITTQRGLNEPRYPSLANIMKAKKKSIVTKTLADIGLSSEQKLIKTKIVSLAYPPRRNAEKVIVEGASAEEKAARLLNLLQDKAGIL
ncbi:MAG: electron transfer flavoprotein subunit beta [Peptococcaceae bacterium BICA1-7]|nr:MAG: electron transfer flavoprotein subunit beta [Peptococcaceae bacterium BICA1-7]HBV95842.1 electron transfer flavoprotein subunit beta/FixA family protein [Desulfotomaculum sp.]